ncbi:MAG: hypothetical protein HC802_16235, partial [Caldilineaceae bacterium]|nr:hypothetical protein [Caldilineaceae bacterium]
MAIVQGNNGKRKQAALGESDTVVELAVQAERNRTSLANGKPSHAPDFAEPAELDTSDESQDADQPPVIVPFPVHPLMAAIQRMPPLPTADNADTIRIDPTPE